MEVPITSLVDVVIVGAGPYGLSLAAHLGARGANFRIFGTPLATWRFAMPGGMMLKSDGFASNLSAPKEGSRLRDYCRSRNLPYHDTAIPVPLEDFVQYGLDFQRRFVPGLECVDVRSVEKLGETFRVILENSEELEARRVVLAVGITHFAHTPKVLTGPSTSMVSHSSQHSDLSNFSGKRVAVVGAGSSAVEYAVGLSRAGAESMLIARSEAIRFSSPLGSSVRPLAKRLRHPSSGLGPGWRSRLSCDIPDAFRYVPTKWRMEFVRRHLGPMSPWRLKEELASNVRVMTGTEVAAIDVDGEQLRIETNGTVPTERSEIRVDHVIAATGYRPDVSRLTFLDPGTASSLKTVGGSPALSRSFESSVPGLYFVGVAAADTFGPLMRFMHGSTFTATRLASALVAEKS